MEIWHNPRCSKSRQTLALLEERGVEPSVRRYLDDPPSVEELRRVLGLLGLRPWELVRTGESLYGELGLADRGRADADVDGWLQVMVANPKLIERPVVIDGERAVIGRPPQDVTALLD